MLPLWVCHPDRDLTPVTAGWGADTWDWEALIQEREGCETRSALSMVWALRRVTLAGQGGREIQEGLGWRTEQEISMVLEKDEQDNGEMQEASGLPAQRGY